MLVLLALMFSVVAGQLVVSMLLPGTVTGTHPVTDGNRTLEVFFDANGSYRSPEHNGTYAFPGQPPAQNRRALILRSDDDNRTVSFPGTLRDRLANIGTVIVFMQLAGIGFAFWLAKHHQLRWREAFGGLGDPANSIALPLLTNMALLPVILLVLALSKLLLNQLGINEGPQQAVQTVTMASSSVELFLQGLSVILLAPIAEEVIFRGIIYNTAKQINTRTAAIIISGILFAAVHGQWTLVPPLFILSLALVWVFEKSGTILAPIVLHAAFNAVNFILMRNPEWVLSLQEFFERHNS